MHHNSLVRTTLEGYNDLSFPSFSFSLPGGVSAPGAPAPAAAAARLRFPYGVEEPVGEVPKLEIDPARPNRNASIPPDRGEEGEAGEKDGEEVDLAGPQGMLSSPLTRGDGGTEESIPPPARLLGREEESAEREKLEREFWFAARDST